MIKGIHNPTSIRRFSRWLALAMCGMLSIGVASAHAIEVHNFLEPAYGSFNHIEGLALNEATGNIYVVNSQTKEVKVLGLEGVQPGSGPASFSGSETPQGEFGGHYNNWGPVAVDNACAYHERLIGTTLSVSECEALDPSNGDIYVYDNAHREFVKYRLSGSGRYEYVCSFASYGESGDACVPGFNSAVHHFPPFAQSEVAVDAAGDVYVTVDAEHYPAPIAEFSNTGEWLRTLQLPRQLAGHTGIPFEGSAGLAIAPGGTIYTRFFNETLNTAEVVEAKRNSLTGPIEGEPKIIPGVEGATGVAFDQATGQLFVDLGSSAIALNGANEIVSRFGAGVVANSEEIAVDGATGEVYLGNGTEQSIDRFGPGLVGTAPSVDVPPPSLTDVGRTSALLSATIDTGNATTSWHLEYVSAAEYRPGSPDPYSGGGSTVRAQLAPAAGATAIGPVPLSSLLAGSTYHYRLVATNELGTIYGPDHTFTTAAATPPAVTTGAAEGVTQTGVLLTGTVDTQGLQTSYEFEVGTDIGYGGAKLFGNAGSGGTETVSASLQFLIPGTTYHYRLVASNEDGTTYGQDMTFTTPGITQALVQPVAESFVPVPTEAFPSVEGAITKAQGTVKSHKRKGKKGNKTKKHGSGRAVGRRNGAGKSAGARPGMPFGSGRRRG